MATMYKTPGVYIEEIPKFPPSIAPVETAIPAFIGHTEKASRNGESLSGKPTRIESIAEYEAWFGSATPQTMEVYLDNNDAFVGSTKTKGFLLYDSLRIFYTNGGGNCYVVSIGNFDASIQKQPFLDALEKLQEEDEPTILVFPDAVNLPDNELHDVQVEALSQCTLLQDRVTLCDVKNSGDFGNDVQTLRNNIGINNLKYGMAYGPWINTSLPRFVYYRDLTIKRDNAAGTVIDLNSLTTDPTITQLLFDVSKAQQAVDSLKSAEVTGAGAGKRWEDEVKKQSDLYNASGDTTLKNLESELQAVYGVLATILGKAKDVIDALPIVVAVPPVPASNQTKEFKLKTDVIQFINGAGIKKEIDVLAAHYNFLRVVANGDINLFSEDPGPAADPKKATNVEKAISLVGYANPAAFLAITDATATAAYATASTERDKANLAKNAVMKASSAVIALYRFVQNSAAEYEKKFNEGLLNGFGLYKNITTKAIETLNLLPPSGAIAGVYASVDRDRGVWKAPANVSLNGVIGPAVKITQDQQAEYNVDVNAGKSINIIRAFTGKGTLVWGARTLAGNDNEWRYVPVRRFFNFVEESVKKATEQFVFEPNDANTWVKVQAMIENFLTTLWRQGALQGIKPEHAFYVAVGLGKTMTALDILEGRMIIEIGMAAVRPAEFIILKFSHKMAES